MDLEFRTARDADLDRIIAMLADDVLGADREDASEDSRAAYAQALHAIEADAGNEIVIAEADGVVVAFLQLTIIPCLTHGGATRAMIEGVRVTAEARGQGVGERLVREAMRRATARGSMRMQLTTDKMRADALRFYERLGFRATHEGLKVDLSISDA